MILQGTPEWRQQRCGKLGASKVGEALARTKSGWGASRANVKAMLVAERLTGTPQETFVNAAMQWGTDTEAQARAAYEFFHDLDVELAAFIDHPAIAMSGCSPDGLVGIKGLVEIKCPNTATHIEALLNQDNKNKYRSQVQWQMAVTEREWCDWVSFDPRLPEHMQMFVRRVPRDDEYITMLEKEVAVFLDDVAETVENLRRSYSPLGSQFKASLDATEAA